jgi:DNA-binding NtrC family response regulator
MVVSKSNLLTEIAEATLSHDSRTENTRHGEFALALAPRRAKDAASQPPNGLVVSSDDEVSRKLAESLGQCGLRPLFACTVVESGIALAGSEVLVVLCDECLADGTYEDIANLVRASHTRIPVVVVSRTGEWSEYLRAVDHGAFDYLAYPPMRGDLQNAIRNALVWNRQNGEVAGAI